MGPLVLPHIVPPVTLVSPSRFLRIGLSQLEGFRRQLLDVLQRSTKPKVGTSSHCCPVG